MKKGPDDPKAFEETRKATSGEQPTERAQPDNDSFAQTAPMPDEHPSIDPVSLRIGELISGRYRILQFLAQGGMGQVYEVEDTELHVNVALKIIRAERADREMELLFRREIQLARKVTHPNVCRVFDVGRHRATDGNPFLFLTMELLEGETLKDRIEREGALPLDDAAAIVRQIASGLSAAHGAGIVHRDLKSANVMLVREQSGVRAVVTDFGLARNWIGEDGRMRSLTGVADIVGTPAYMAPEQVENTAVTAAADIYALGIVMYEMVTGTLPFDGKTPMAIATKRLTELPQPPRERRRGLPLIWQEIILACLERLPARRPTNALEVLDLVESPDSSLRVARLVRRTPWVRPLSALLTLSVVALVVFAILHQRREELGPLLTRRGVHLGQLAIDGQASGHGVALRGALRTALLGTVPIIASPLVLGSGADVLQLGVATPPRDGTPLELTGRIKIEGHGAEQVISVTLSLVDPANGRQRWGAAQQGNVTELAGLAEHLADRLRVDARLTLATPAPPTASALATLGHVSEALGHDRPEGVLPEIEGAVIAEPGVAELWVQLARVLDALTLDVAADVARQRISALPLPSDALWRGRAVALTERLDSTRRVAELEEMRRRWPEDFDIGLELFNVLLNAQRHDETQQLFAALTPLATTAISKLRLRLAELNTGIWFEDEARVIASYPAVVAAAVALHEDGLQLQALLYACDAAIAIRPALMDATCGQLPAHARPDVLVRAQLARVKHAEVDGTAPLPLARALRILAQEIGASGAITFADGEIGGFALQGKEWATADDALQEGIVLARARHDTWASTYLFDLGAAIAEARGDFAATRTYRLATLELARDAGNGEQVAYIATFQASADLDAAHTADATKLMNELATPHGWRDAVGIDLYRNFAAALATETGRPADAAAEVAAAQHDPPVDTFTWGRWSHPTMRAVIAYLRWNPVELDKAAREALALVHDKNARDALRVELLADIGAATRGKRMSDAELAALQTRVEAYAGNVRPFLQLLMLTLRRVRGGESQGALVHDIDAYIAARSEVQARWALRGRLEKARALATFQDPQARTVARALVDDATAVGFVLVAEQAKQLAR